MADEKRLIDANSLIEDLELLAKHEEGFQQSVILGVVHTVKARRTVDAVEVVRCRDCIRRYDTDECPMCFLSGGQYYEFTRDDGFCDRGERKDNG